MRQNCLRTSKGGALIITQSERCDNLRRVKIHDTIINNEFNFPHKSDERMRVKKMTPRAPEIFLISSARPRIRIRSLPLPLHTLILLSFPFAERVLRACTLIYAYNVPTLRTVAQELLDRRILFLLLLLPGPLSLSLSFSTSLMRAPFSARSDPGFSPVTRTRVSYFLYNQFGARDSILFDFEFLERFQFSRSVFLYRNLPPPGEDFLPDLVNIPLVLDVRVPRISF